LTYSAQSDVSRLSEVICALVVSLHCIFLFFQTSVVGADVIPHFLLRGNWIHLVFICVPVALFLLRKAKYRDLGQSNRSWSIGAYLVGAYGLIVFNSSMPSINDFGSFTQVFLVSATIFSLTFCVPRVMNSSGYCLTISAILCVMVLHSLLTFYLMLSGTEQVFHRDITGGAGREKFFFGITLPRINGLFKNANAIGSFLMYWPGILLSAPTFSLPPLAQWISLAVISLALTLSFSRAAELTVLLGLAVPALAHRKSAPFKSALACLALAVTTAVVLWPTFEPAVHSSGLAKISIGSPLYQSQSRANEAKEPLIERNKIWIDMMEQTAGTRLKGAGLMNVEYHGLSPHNFLLANLVYFGLPGLGLILSILAVCAWQLVKRVRTYPALLPAAGTIIAVVLLHGQAEYVLTHPLFFSNSMFWLLLGFVCFSPIKCTGEK